MQCERLGFNPWVRKTPWRRATHSSVLAWRIPWTEEPGGLGFIGLQKAGMTEATWHTHKEDESPISLINFYETLVSKKHTHHFFNFFTEVELIYNIITVSGVQHGNSTFLYIIFHLVLLQSNGYISLRMHSKLLWSYPAPWNPVTAALLLI